MNIYCRCLDWCAVVVWCAAVFVVRSKHYCSLKTFAVKYGALIYMPRFSCCRLLAANSGIPVAVAGHKTKCCTAHYLQKPYRTQRLAELATRVCQVVRNLIQAFGHGILSCIPQSVKDHLPRKTSSWFKLVITICTAIILKTSDIATDIYSGYKHWM